MKRPTRKLGNLTVRRKKEHLPGAVILNSYKFDFKYNINIARLWRIYCSKRKRTKDKYVLALVLNEKKLVYIDYCDYFKKIEFFYQRQLCLFLKEFIKSYYFFNKKSKSSRKLVFLVRSQRILRRYHKVLVNNRFKKKKGVEGV